MWTLQTILSSNGVSRGVELCFQYRSSWPYQFRYQWVSWYLRKMRDCDFPIISHVSGSISVTFLAFVFLKISSHILYPTTYNFNCFSNCFSSTSLRSNHLSVISHLRKTVVDILAMSVCEQIKLLSSIFFWLFLKICRAMTPLRPPRSSAFKVSSSTAYFPTSSCVSCAIVSDPTVARPNLTLRFILWRSTLNLMWSLFCSLYFTNSSSTSSSLFFCLSQSFLVLFLLSGFTRHIHFPLLAF